MEEEEIEKEEKEEVEAFKKVVNSFNNNIHPITPMEYEKLQDWCRDMDCEVVIAAIEESVKYNVRTMAYIEKVLNNWLSKGLNKIEKVLGSQRAFQNRKKKVKESNYLPNAKAYELFEEVDD